MANDARREPDGGDWSELLGDVLTRLPAYGKLGWLLARSRELPRRSKLGLAGGVLYSLSPLDLVPGIIPVLGQLDDLAALLGGIRSALRRCPPERAAALLRQCGLEADQLDRDLATLGKIAARFSAAVARGAWRGSRRAAGVLGRGVRASARRLLRAYLSSRSGRRG